MDLDSLLPQPWMARGSCTNHPDPDLWHTDELDELPKVVAADRTREAIGICRQCPVSTECEAFGRQPGPSVEYGVYGGTRPDQRGRKDYVAGQLAERDREVRVLSAQGLTTRQIGAQVGLDHSSVVRSLARTA